MLGVVQEENAERERQEREKRQKLKQKAKDKVRTERERALAERESRLQAEKAQLEETRREELAREEHLRCASPSSIQAIETGAPLVLCQGRARFSFGLENRSSCFSGPGVKKNVMVSPGWVGTGN